jgi:hypothetical protein
MKPEERAEIILWDWLKTKSSAIREVYFNRENKLGWKTFRVEGLQKKPDLIIEYDKGYGSEFIIVEVKPSDKSLDILRGSKIYDVYLKNYVEGLTRYFIEKKEIKINHFLIGTDNSINGYLFKNEPIIDNLSSTESKSKHYAASIGIIPKKEGGRTFEFIRFLWNEYGKIRNNYPQKLSLGILIGDISDEFKPKMMITFFDKIKNRWSQRFWEL